MTNPGGSGADYLPRMPAPLKKEEVCKEEREALGIGKDDLTALCLSGGGIRSAAFCLGALQALAKGDLLEHFHYLSTVSGGGYIGSWLTRCIGEQRSAEQRSAAPQPKKTLNQILKCILKDFDSSQITALRRYVNFLTPNPGIASNDTWAGIVLWFRNTLINWLVFLPLLLGGAAIPVLYLALVHAFLAQNGGPEPDLSYFCGAVGLGALFIAVVYSCCALPSHAFADAPIGREVHSEGLSDGRVFGYMVLPGLVWAVLAPLAVTSWLRLPADDLRAAFWSAATCPTSVSPRAMPLCPSFLEPPAGLSWAGGEWSWLWCWFRPAPLSFLVMLAAYLAAGAWIMIGHPGQRRETLRLFARNLPGWIASCAVSAGLLALGIWLAIQLGAFWIAVAGPAWVTLADTLRVTIYVALRQEGLRADLDREWLARLNASKLRVVVALSLGGLCALYLPKLVFDQYCGPGGFIVAVVGFLTGPLIAGIGRSALTSFTGAPLPQHGPAGLSSRIGSATAALVVPLAVTLFAATLFMGAGRAVEWLVEEFSPPGFFTFAGEAALVLVTAVLLAILLDNRINLNRFSLHAVYRNRLVRAFLGTARKDDERRPDRFTSFDPGDNTRVYDNVARNDNGVPSQKALFHVINVTLNRTVVTDTARAARKADSFTITPLHCGSASLKDRDGAFVQTEYYARGRSKETGRLDARKGITLGTAMAISGAAASPNMGYHSSPLLAFVMTLFNVRLGAWLPNPGMTNPCQRKIEMAGPSSGLWTMFEDLTGRAGIEGDFVYLSDGGHFDNLGLYEMLRRKCKFILIVDAGQDERYGYQDLGRALQYALIDFGVNAEFVQPIRVAERALRHYGAYADLTYKGGGSGQLIYLKPWLPITAPMELQAFKALKESFPHESTLDQFFTENDFESYRRLGEHLVDELLKTPRPSAGVPPDLPLLFAAVRVKAEVARNAPSVDR